MCRKPSAGSGSSDTGSWYPGTGLRTPMGHRPGGSVDAMSGSSTVVVMVRSRGRVWPRSRDKPAGSRGSRLSDSRLGVLSSFRSGGRQTWGHFRNVQTCRSSSRHLVDRGATACAASNPPATVTIHDTVTQTESASSPTSAPKHPASNSKHAKTSAAVEETVKSAADSNQGSTADTFVMPNEVGNGLQDAQDSIQGVSRNLLFYTSSNDATGKGRHQVLDRDWKVSAKIRPRELASTPTPTSPSTS